MGAKIGAIPSAIGGRSIELSHVGMVFPITPTALERWRGWFRHIVRDQVAVWMLCSFIGLALPCMLSLEFLRNTPVSDHRVAAMTAEGMSLRFPSIAQPLWFFTLFVGFLTLAPCAVYSGDLLARHWTDILWVTSPRVKKLAGNQVRLIYYSLLGIYAVWGTITLAPFSTRFRSPSSGRSWETSRWGSRRFIPCTSTARSSRVSYAATCSCSSA